MDDVQKTDMTEATGSGATGAQTPDASPTGRPQAGFRAHLQGIGLHDLVMLQNLVRSTGAFVVISGDRTGTLHFSRGQLVHAVSGDLVGDPAALDILSWGEGEFITSERDGARSDAVQPTTVVSSIESLLLRLAKEEGEPLPAEPPLSTATGVRRRTEGSPLMATPEPELDGSSGLPAQQRLAAAATPGVAALAPKSPLRAGEPRSGFTHVLVAPHGAVLDGNGPDHETLGSKVAYMARLAEVIGLAMGAGEARSVKVRHAGNELLMRRFTDGHVSASLGPVDPAADAVPPASMSPPPARLT